MPCEDCNGQGRIDGVRCFQCNGTGELCDRCGEAIDTCECSEDEEE